MRQGCIAIACLLLAACGSKSDEATSSAPAPPPLKPFQFRDLTIGASLESAKGSVARCHSFGDSDTVCDLKDNVVAGWPTLGTWASFHEKRLKWLSAEWPTMRYDAVLAAFTQAYGEPCRTDHKVLQNGFGATFSGDEATWCFKEGVLNLQRYGSNNNTEVIFEGYKNEPAKTYSKETL